MPKRLLIKLRNPGEIAKERIARIVAESEATFFPQPNNKPLLFPISDGYHQFSEEDIETIRRRLNYQPNLFRVNFDVSVIPSSIDIGGYEDYVRIEVRRVA